MVTITECTEVTDEVVEVMDRLIRQLSSSNPPPGRSELEEIVASEAATLLLARLSHSASGTTHDDVDHSLRDKPSEDNPFEDKPQRCQHAWQSSAGDTFEEKPPEGKPQRDNLLENNTPTDKPLQDNLLEDNPLHHRQIRQQSEHQYSEDNPLQDKPLTDEPLGSAANRQDATRLGEIVGALTLVTYRIPTGVRARIEDVVVEEAVRGQQVGEMLSSIALAQARDLGAVSVDLTSRPSRIAANRLYQRMGFEQRSSNVYRFKL